MPSGKGIVGSFKERILLGYLSGGGCARSGRQRHQAFPSWQTLSGLTLSSSASISTLLLCLNKKLYDGCILSHYGNNVLAFPSIFMKLQLQSDLQWVKLTQLVQSLAVGRLHLVSRTWDGELALKRFIGMDMRFSGDLGRFGNWGSQEVWRGLKGASSQLELAGSQI